ncbi:5-(carboxyamino)imidazole ribonucleotide synthase [Crenobacter cavernae]|uniref:N5-carboxyaminoimidazole ribonucleotide synthase n=1 Tax=Crenobacter cavernae TaxID=2290923 RepID=A0A345Y410_9NEIS|nr:5-(carboxyamino)imidazole ribonucleotide synthase [Crenobacter cavernae]AXK38662.1 5-(carboxyamino)imidazole ribonucleotide synthase [Crenobacter cavernae]
MSAKAILPPSMLGILGGGQLGRMFAAAAKTMGYRVTVLDPDEAAPAADFADVHIKAPFNDAQALDILAKTCAAITTEFENVNADAMRELARRGVRVAPSGDCVAVAQNRIVEKGWIKKAGLATVPYLAIETVDDLHTDLAPYLPGILKTARLGYDGKGQVLVETASAAREAYADLGGQACVLEKRVELKAEVSVIVTRVSHTQMNTFPVAENRHEKGILDVSIVPATLSPFVAETAQGMAKQLADALDYVGVLAVEFFVLEDDTLLINEIAPRPHNSGHYTLDACITSQFQQQVRALCGLLPGSTALLKPAVMVNLLGDVWPESGREPNWAVLMEAPNVELHLYGKREARPGRKMGHFTVLADSAEAALVQAEALKDTL